MTIIEQRKDQYNRIYTVSLGEVTELKTEYTKIIENNPTKKARILTKRISENEYEIVEMDIPIELRFKGIEDELLREITDDADIEGITLHMDINRLIQKNGG